MITVPTLIAGIYGMNFKYMPELDWRSAIRWSFSTMVAIDACFRTLPARKWI